ncbi:3-oxoacyl-[acyl-carrier protein] reductase [Leucobacter exalbidus]|uniref:3-oxoacyl-[acyl-carrier protein] reductase n=1 Tax=Leucobacter exalbidus TaxID=662960 RepID=A0A940PSA5_9MICO|nr:SDR family oxidoreductase [Leucobacter exalbidus]MBP1326599.1 3-oxoacyl-[acyl-carrier protein] reductase [Leucobacter exalbidus]
MSAGRLAGKIAIITGGGSGLGRASAQLFLNEGATVIVADLDSPEVAADLKALGVQFVPTDVSKSAEVDALVAGVVKEHGRLDVMFNNAGIFLGGPVLETTDEGFARNTAVNFGGAFYGLRAAGNVMKEQGFGSIINTASNGAVSPTAGMAVYCGTKGAIVSMSKAAAIELAPTGVRVNTLSPGTMLTAMAASNPSMADLLDGLQPVGYAAQPHLMGYGAVFLASDEAQYVTGHDLVVDGGATTGRGW